MLSHQQVVQIAKEDIGSNFTLLPNPDSTYYACFTQTRSSDSEPFPFVQLAVISRINGTILHRNTLEGAEIEWKRPHHLSVWTPSRTKDGRTSYIYDVFRRTIIND